MATEFENRQQALIDKNLEKLKNREQTQEKSDLEILAERIRETESPTAVEDNILKAYDMMNDTIKGLTRETIAEKKQAYKQGAIYLHMIKEAEVDFGDHAEKIIDKYENILQQGRESNIVLEKLAEDLKENLIGKLPTLDRFVSSIVDESNPLIKVGMNIFGEAHSYMKNIREAAKDEEEKRKEALEDLIATQDEVGELNKEVAENHNELLKEQVEETKKRKKGDGPLVSRMELLKQENVKQTDILKSLHDIWSDRPYDDSHRDHLDNEKANDLLVPEDMIGTVGEEESDLLIPLDSIDETLLDNVDATKEVSDKLDSLIAIEEQRIRQDQKNRLTERGRVSPTTMKTPLGAAEERKGNLGKLLGAMAILRNPGALLAAISGGTMLGSFIGSVTPFLTRVGAVIKPVMIWLPRLARGAGLVGLVIGFVKGVFDFIDGFKNADKILDKTDVDMRDKIAAGIASFFGAFVGIIDDILGLFGFDTNLKEEFTKRYAKYLSAVMHPIDTMKDIIEKITSGEFFEDMKKKVTNVLNAPVRIFDGVMDMIKDAVDLIPDVLLPKAIKNWINGSENTPVPEKAPTGPEVPIQPSSHRELSGQVRNYNKDVAQLEEEERKRRSEANNPTSINPIVQNNRVDQSRVMNFNAGINTRNNDAYLFP